MSRVRLNNLYLNAGALDFHRARQFSGSIDAAERCRAYLASMAAVEQPNASGVTGLTAPSSTANDKRRCFMVGYVVQWPPRWRVDEEMRRRLCEEAEVDTDADEWQSVRAQFNYTWHWKPMMQPVPLAEEVTTSTTASEPSATMQTPMQTPAVQQVEQAVTVDGEELAARDESLSAGLGGMSLKPVKVQVVSPVPPKEQRAL